MVDTVRYGLIGCGMMGQEHIRNVALLDGAEVTAIYEPDDAMARAGFALTASARRSASLDDLVGQSDIDALIIASPNFCHVDQMEEIAAKRALPILVEKPLFTDPSDAAKLKAFRDSYRAPVWVAMEYRYMPPIAAFLERAATATGGVQMLTIREHRFPFLPKVGDWNRFNRYTGGTFVEKCCHFFDLMRLTLASEPIRVMASAAQSVNHLDECYDGETPDIIDNGYVILDFANGSRAMLELCMFAEGSRYQEELSAVGPGGKIEAFVPGPGRFWPSDLGPAPISKVIESPRHPKGPVEIEIPVDASLLEAGDHNGSTFYQHQRFLDLVRGQKSQPDVSLMDGWRAVMMGMAAQQSAAEGRSVDICF